MFDFLFNPQGRISRKGIWLGYFLPYLAITIVLSIIEGIVPALGFLSVIVGLFYLWPGIGAVPAKRLHDLGLSGWWLLLIYAVSFGLLIWLIVAVIGGASGTDAFGAFEDGSFERMTETEQMALLGELFAAGFSSGAALIPTVLLGIASIASFVVFYCWPGQRADNRFGRDPLADGRGFGDSPGPSADTFA